MAMIIYIFEFGLRSLTIKMVKSDQYVFRLIIKHMLYAWPVTLLVKFHHKYILSTCQTEDERLETYCCLCSSMRVMFHKRFLTNFFFQSTNVTIQLSLLISLLYCHKIISCNNFQLTRLESFHFSQ